MQHDQSSRPGSQPGGLGEPSVRDATVDDLPAITRIYNWTIVDNHVSFDTDPYTDESRLSWWQARSPQLPCLVAELDGAVVGVSYASWYRPKLGYRTSMETTIVLDTDHLGHGLGTLLLGSMLDRLASDGVHRAIAIIAMPNDASVALHLKLGYREVGTLTEVGTKNGTKWDTTLFEYDLTDHQPV